MNLKKMIFSILILVCSITINAQTAEDVISKYVVFTGGEKQWKTIHTIISSGIYNYGGVEFPFMAYSKAPNLYKFVVPFKGKYYAQAFNGKTGWKIDAFKNQTKRTLLKGKEALAMANEADVTLESPLIDYKKKGHAATLEKIDTLNGVACFKIKFIRNEGDTENYFFNTIDFSLIEKEAVSKNAEMENKILDTFYSDYRVVDGVKIPFKSTSKSGDQTILTITTNKVEINVQIADNRFQ